MFFEDKFLHFFALHLTTGLKIPGAVIPLNVFTQPGSLNRLQSAGGVATKWEFERVQPIPTWKGPLPPTMRKRSLARLAHSRRSYRFFSISLAVLLRTAFAATVGLAALAGSAERAAVALVRRTPG
jgi:hypothetical protein